VLTARVEVMNKKMTSPSRRSLIPFSASAATVVVVFDMRDNRGICLIIACGQQGALSMINTHTHMHMHMHMHMSDESILSECSKDHGQRLSSK